MKTWLLLLMLVCSFNARSANISGKITDAENQPAIAANVVLLKADSTKKLVKATVTNEDGLFVFDGIPDGSYIIKVTLTGYQNQETEIKVQGADITIPVIKMSTKSTELKEVSVRAQKPLIEVFADKLVVNVENSIVSAGSSVLEVLEKSPGVRVDQNDNISLKGKPGITVMIDGKIQPMSGTDLANVLRSMPSNSVEKIELISNPGARYDAAGTAGIINIRTKKDKRMGMNGSVNASYAQGVYPKMNTGVNVNYRNKKLTINASYNYAYRYWFNHLMLNRRFYDSAERLAFVYDQNNFAVFNFSNHNGGLGLDYNLSQKTTIGMSGNTAVNNFSPRADNASRALDGNNDVIYYFDTKGRHKNSFAYYALNGYLRHSFDSSGKELSVDVDYARYFSNSNQNFETIFRRTDGSEYLPAYYMKSNLKGLTQIRSVKADYANPLKGNARFDVGVKSSYVTADNEPLFYERNPGDDFRLDTNRSNHFLYQENINAAYVNVNKEWEKWGGQVGLRMENTNVTANQITLDSVYKTNYTQLFPSIAVQRHLNKNNDLGVTLSRRIERPNYEQLNPFKFFIDKTTYREGYPYLRPALSYNIELSHTYKQRFVTTLSYSITDNVITEVIQPSDNEDSITVQTNKNLTRMTFYGLSGAYPFQINKWWSNVTNFNVYYAHYEGFIANTNLSNGSPTFFIQTNNTFTLPKDFSAELGYWYSARQIYGFMDVRPTSMLSAGIQKNFFDKKLTVRLNAQDILWKGYPRATSTYNNYQEDFVARRDTRQFTLALTYRFGKKTVAPVRRRAGGAEEEKQRVGSGGS